jgi:ubiquinone/menaquinone biosynthesis C-methylase UbiE
MANPAQVYESFFVPAIFVPCTQLLVETAAPKPGERVLDVACGTGIVARTIAPLVGASGSVTGVDLSPDMIEVARAQIPARTSIDFRVGNALELESADRSIDLVTCQHGLQFFPDRLAGTRQMRRVLVDGGRAVVLCWKSIDHHELYPALFESEARFLGVPTEQLATPFSLGDARELEHVLREAGFSSVEVHPYTIDARFESADMFVRLTAIAGSAVMPELATDIEALVAHVQRECAGEVAKHRVGDRIEIKMAGNLAIARA